LSGSPLEIRERKKDVGGKIGNYKGQIMLEKAEELGTSWAYKQEKLPLDGLLLLDNVQFIYELALAQLELRALGVNYEITNGLREFKLIQANDPETFRRRTAYFKSISGKLSDYFYIIQKNRTRSVNQYLTHWIYPYKGKFHPQMIRALLNIMKLKPGDTVLDPFIGSGTTAVEAQLLGINCIGVDISPLCVLQSRVKTESLEVIDEIVKLKQEVSYFVEPTLFSINQSLQDYICAIRDERVRNFYQMVQLVAISDAARRKKDFKKSFFRNLELMIASVKDYKEIAQELRLELGDVRIEVGDARNLPLEGESVDGIITSPPYSIALDYIANDAHALEYLGVNLQKAREEFIGMRGRGKMRVHLYNEDMKTAYREMLRVLKPGKFAAIVIGNATYQGREIRTVKFTIDYMERLGFHLLRNIDKIIFGLYNVMQKENILIFQKA